MRNALEGLDATLHCPACGNRWKVPATQIDTTHLAGAEADSRPEMACPECHCAGYVVDVDARQE